MSGGDQSDVLMDRTVLRRVQGAISYECWTGPGFNNELQRDRKSNNMAADHKSQGHHLF